MSPIISPTAAGSQGSALTDHHPVPATHSPYVVRSLQLACSWSLAGGAAAGLVLALLLAAGQIHDLNGVAVMAVGLGALTSFLGTLHGALLGFLSRPEGAVRPVATRDRIFFVATSTASFVAGVVTATWLPLSVGLVRVGMFLGWLGIFVAGTITVLLFTWAWDLGWHALRVAYERWPEHRLGGALLAGTFLGLCALLLALRPALPLESGPAAMPAYVIIAAAATVWVAAPVLVFALRRRMRGA